MAYSLQEDDFYHCSVCLDDMTERNPRLLACHHSFCEECLVKLVRRGNIECPSCRHVTPVTDNDVSKLSKNFLLLGIKERETKLLTAAKHVTLCHICNREVAGYKCLDCNELMCQKCIDKHSKSQRFKNHKVVVKCDIHNEGITHICSKCVKGVCSKCIILDHSDHDDLVYDYRHGIDMLHSDIDKLCLEVKSTVTSVESIVQQDEKRVMKENQSKKLLKEKRDKLVAEAERIKDIMDGIDRKHEKVEPIHRECKETCHTGHEVLRNCEKLNKIEGGEFLMAYPEIKSNLETVLNKTNQIRCKYESTYVPVDFNLSDYLPGYNKRVKWEKKPTLIATFTKGKPFSLNCPWQVACLDNNLFAIADLQEDNVLIVNYEGKVMMSYKVKKYDGDVTSVYSNDGKTLYIVQRKCITIACYPSANTKTYHPDLHYMMGVNVSDGAKIIIYSSTSVCEYEQETNKVKQVVRGLYNCNMCLPYKDTDTSNQRYIVIDDNKEEDNIKVYNDRWILIQSFGPHGSQDGMLNQPRCALIVDDNLLVCDRMNHHVSCFSLDGEFKFNVLSDKDIQYPFGISFSFPFLWITELNSPKLATIKGFQYTK